MDYLFHVTTAPRLEGIEEEGLCPARGPSIGGVPESHKRGRVFLCDFERVSYWASRAEAWVTSEYDDYAEKGMALVVARVPRGTLDPQLLKPDDLGTSDSRRPAYAYEGVIAPENAEVWDGSGWCPVSASSVDATLGFSEDGYFRDSSPLLNPPRPLPLIEGLPLAPEGAEYPAVPSLGWGVR